MQEVEKEQMASHSAWKTNKLLLKLLWEKKSGLRLKN